MSPSVRWWVALLIPAILAPGCARALKAPPSLESLGGGGAALGPGAVDGLLEKARIQYSGRTREEVRRARELWLQAARADTGRLEGLIGAARASAWLADHQEEREMRLEAAELAVQAGQWCGKVRQEEPACAYWLGVGLGLQARERRSTAMDALPRIEEAFRRAATEAPEMERGGPQRALALLYVRAPGWPTGPGDPELGLEHARMAVAIDPEFPPNLLALAEALAANGDTAGSREACRTARDLAREAASHGEPDAGDWVREAETALRAQER